MGGPARGNNPTVIQQFNRRPLPEGWEHSSLENHLYYKGTMVGVMGRGGCAVELKIGKWDDAKFVFGSD